jgi:hypothetical protein
MGFMASRSKKCLRLLPEAVILNDYPQNTIGRQDVVISLMVIETLKKPPLSGQPGAGRRQRPSQAKSTPHGANTAAEKGEKLFRQNPASGRETGVFLRRMPQKDGRPKNPQPQEVEYLGKRGNI